jgi:predicted Zn-dependent protease
MSQPPPSLVPALSHFRRGDLPSARAAVESALAKEPEAAPLLEFAGLVSARMGDPAAAVTFFRRLTTALPDDRAARLNLAMALVAAGDFGEAEALTTNHLDEPRLQGLRAYVRQQQGRLEEAAADYAAVVEK